MSSTTDDDHKQDADRNAYPLNRDVLASARLHLQHQVWIASLGYLLHPSITIDKKDAKNDPLLIAEVGCGTGAFALQLSSNLSSKTPSINHKIEAYDISLSQTPPPAFCPESVTFNTLDIFAPIPEELVGKYDVLCIRHFICVIQSGDPTRLLQQLLRMLKPSGYLQWQEWDISSNTLLTSGKAAPKLEAFMELTQGPTAIQEQAAWVNTFREHPLLSSNNPDAEAEMLAHDCLWTAKEALLLKQEIGFLGAREWVGNLQARGEMEQAERIEKVAREAEEECWALGRGTVVDGEMVTWVLKKKGE